MPIGSKASSIAQYPRFVLTSDLARMYGLLVRIPNGLEPLRKKFEDHVRRAGIEAVQKVLPAPGATTDAGKADVLVSTTLRSGL